MFFFCSSDSFSKHRLNQFKIGSTLQAIRAEVKSRSKLTITGGIWQCYGKRKSIPHNNIPHNRFFVPHNLPPKSCTILTFFLHPVRGPVLYIIDYQFKVQGFIIISTVVYKCCFSEGKQFIAINNYTTNWKLAMFCRHTTTSVCGHLGETGILASYTESLSGSLQENLK